MSRYHASAVKWLVRDAVRARGVKLLSYARLLQYALRFPRTGAARYRLLMDSHRYHRTRFAERRLVRDLPRLTHGLRPAASGPYAQVDFDRVAARTIVLKDPRMVGTRIEKGVLLITFTESFGFFVDHIDCETLLQYFYVVLEPSWAGYAEPTILFWTRFGDSPVIVQSPERTDYEFIESLRSNLVPVEFGSSDWVDPRLFHPLDGVTKHFDAICVANYNPIKRHHVLLRAVRAMRDPTYRVALVCAKWGGTREAVEDLIDYYGVRRNVVIHEELPPPAVNELLNRAKVNMLLSVKEGANRSVFEGFFAGVPAVVLRNNIGVNKTYLNSHTGRLTDERSLCAVLRELRESWTAYRPREWALQHISPTVTATRLSRRLQAVARERGEPWSRDVVPKVNVPEVRHFSDADTLRLLPSRLVLSAFLKASPDAREDRAAFMRRLSG